MEIGEVTKHLYAEYAGYILRDQTLEYIVKV